MDSIDFNHHEKLFIAARKSGGKLAKKQGKHKTKTTEVID